MSAMSIVEVFGRGGFAALILSVLLAVALASCAVGQPETVLVTREVTREVEVPVTMEVTRVTEVPVEVLVPVTEPAPSPVVERVEVPVTRIVESTQEIEIPATVLVTRVVREVAVETVEVPVTVEVTRISDRDVVVTVLVPVTQEPSTHSIQIPDELCSDYPYMIALKRAQRSYYEAKTKFARSVEIQDFYRTQADSVAIQVRALTSNFETICAEYVVSDQPSYRFMNSPEGWGMCAHVANTVRTEGSGIDLSLVPLGERTAIKDVVLAYRDSCLNGSTDIFQIAFADSPAILDLLAE